MLADAPGEALSCVVGSHGEKRCVSELFGRPHVPVVGIWVWPVSLAVPDDVVAEAATVLTPGELAGAQAGIAPVRRRRVLLRAALRILLGATMGVPASAVPLRLGPTGRPELAVSGPGAADANCSAAGDVGLVAVSGHGRVGVDVERVTRWDPGVLAEGWLAADEQDAVLALPLADRAVAVARCWTRKEAVVKARGTGISDNLAALAGRPTDPAADIAGWRTFSLQMPEGFVASLAAPAPSLSGVAS